MNFIKYILIFIPFITSCKSQIHIVDKVSNEICIELNKVENIKKITENQVKSIIGLVLIANNTEWNNELDKIENSRNNGRTIFGELLTHRLLLTCENYRVVNNRVIDKTLIDKPNKRELYLKVKDFILSAELGIKTDDLLSFFDKSKNTTEHRKYLKSLQNELIKHTEKSGIYIMRLERDDNSSVFVINIFDYVTGNKKVFIKILFKDESDNLIDDISFRNELEMESERKKRKKEDNDLILPLPPPPGN